MNNAVIKTLKLDCTYRPLEVIDSLEALILCIVGKAIAVEEYEHRINSPSRTFNLPSVIVLKSVVKFMNYTLSPNRSNILWRDKGICQYCANKFNNADLTLDHIIPKSRGGQNSWTNLVACCKDCNQIKSNRTPEEARMKLIAKPKKPTDSILRNMHEMHSSWENYLW